MCFTVQRAIITILSRREHALLIWQSTHQNTASRQVGHDVDTCRSVLSELKVIQYRCLHCCFMVPSSHSCKHKLRY